MYRPSNDTPEMLRTTYLFGCFWTSKCVQVGRELYEIADEDVYSKQWEWYCTQQPPLLFAEVKLTLALAPPRATQQLAKQPTGFAYGLMDPKESDSTCDPGRWQFQTELGSCGALAGAHQLKERLRVELLV